MRTPGWIVAAALGSWLVVGAAAAQTTDPVPDATVLVTNTVGTSNAPQPETPGSIFSAIDVANGLTGQSNVDYVSISIAESLLNLSIVLEDPLPIIDLSTTTTPDPRVDLDGTDAPAFVITTADPVPTDFVLLHVRTGRADLVNLDLESGLTDANGDPVPLTVQVDANGLLGFRYDEDFAFDENITGAGGVVIESESVVTFAGTNDYTGGTQVVSGTLLGNTASLPGDFDLEETTRLEFQIDDVSQTSVFAGNVTGKGRLVKSGLGTLFLSGGPMGTNAATHTGGTEVAVGVLQATPDSLTGDVSVARAAELWLVQDGATPFDGSISGEGALRKTGATPLVLGGANTFTGGLFVSEGEVRGTTSSIRGNVVLEAVTPPIATAQVVFDQATAGTHTGTISGSGVLRKEGTGRVLRQGVTNVSTTEVAGGTLAGDVPALGATIDVAAAGATAEFLLSSTQVFGGSLFGPGDVAKTGPGVLVLGADALHSGTTTVAAGTLQLDAALTNSALTQVEAGARLLNVSGLIGGSLENRGNVSPGGATATLAVLGGATLEAGSVLEVTVDDAGNASRLAISGTASLAGPSYELDLVAGDYSAPVTFTVLTAGALAPGSVPGQALDDLAFVDVVAPPAFVGPSVQMTIQEDFTNIGALGVTPNQKTTGNALEQVTNSGSADARVIRDALVPLRTAQVPAVLDSMAGETLSGFTNARNGNARAFADAISRRLHASNWELTPAPAVPPADVRLEPVDAPPRVRGGPGAWVEPFGLFGTNEGRGNASDMDTNAFGLSAGFDYRVPERWPFPDAENYRFGVAVGYTRTWLENDTGFMTGTADTVQTALYAGYRSEHFHVGAAGRYAWSSMSTDRLLAFTDLYRHAVGRFEGDEWGGLVEVGGHFGHRRRARFHPLARFQYVHTTQDGFAESGAGDLSLAVPDLAFDSLLLTLGARVSRVFTLEGEFGIEPELRAAWTVDYGDRGRHVPALFYAVPGATPFTTAGTEPDRNAFVIGGGYVMRLGDRPLLSTHYDVSIGENHTVHVLSAGIFLRW